MSANILHSVSQNVVEPMLWAIVAMLVIVALKLLFSSSMKGKVGEALISKKLRNLGDDVLDDIILPGKKGGLTQLDHVVRLPQGILVVETKNYKGRIFGRGRDKQWTQRLGRKSYRFKNPLHQNYGHIQAVKALVDDVPVMGRVVFLGLADFPKGMPEGVSKLSTLQTDMTALPWDIMDATRLDIAWQRLKAASQTDKSARRSHLEEVQGKCGKSLKKPVGMVFLLLAGLLAVGLLLRDM